MGEPALTDLRQLAEQLADAIIPLARRTPYALYGHSMGAWVAYETARVLRDRKVPPPERLFVGARRAPHLPSSRPPLSSLPRDAFVAGVQERYQAIPQALLDKPAILDLFLPTLRADFEALETYAPRPAEPLTVPIVAFRGVRDDTMDTPELRAWGEHTSGRFEHHTLPGGHFFLDEDRDLLSGFLGHW